MVRGGDGSRLPTGRLVTTKGVAASSLKIENRETQQDTYAQTGIIWPGEVVMTRVLLSGSLLANVNQVCLHCRPGEVEHWPDTPPATPTEKTRETEWGVEREETTTRKPKAKTIINPRPWQCQSNHWYKFNNFCCTMEQAQLNCWNYMSVTH